MSWVAVGVTVVGAGISAAGMMQQSSAQSKAAGVQSGIDKQNASINREQARLTSMGELRAAELASAQGEIGLIQNQFAAHGQKLQDLYQQSQMMFSAVQADRDAVILDSQAKIHEYNSERLFLFGRQVETLGRDRARRIRMQGERILGESRAGFAKSGVVESGSALDVLADTAGLMELSAQDAMFESRVDSQNAYTESDNQKIAGTIAGFNAQTAKSSSANIRKGIEFAKAGSKINQEMFGLEHQSGLMALQGIEYRKQMAQFGLKMADAGYSINMQQSSLNQFAAMSQARATQFAAAGTMVSGLSSASMTYGTLRPPGTSAQPTAQRATAVN